MRLVIDYILEGENRGYGFVTSTDHVPPEVVKTIWRRAMPRGQGWASEVYARARSLKCIPLDNGRIALSEVTVTDRRDESGRQGLRRAEITLIPVADYPAYVDAVWASLPERPRQAAERRFGRRFWRRMIDAALPQMNAPSQIVLTYPYTSAEDWQVVEACVLKLAVAQRVRSDRAVGGVTPFTTLALDYREESPIVAIPTQAAARLKAVKGVSVIALGG